MKNSKGKALGAVGDLGMIEEVFHPLLREGGPDQVARRIFKSNPTCPAYIESNEAKAGSNAPK